MMEMPMTTTTTTTTTITMMMKVMKMIAATLDDENDEIHNLLTWRKLFGPALLEAIWASLHYATVKGSDVIAIIIIIIIILIGITASIINIVTESFQMKSVEIIFQSISELFR